MLPKVYKVLCRMGGFGGESPKATILMTSVPALGELAHYHGRVRHHTPLVARYRDHHGQERVQGNSNLKLSQPEPKPTPTHIMWNTAGRHGACPSRGGNV